MKTLNTENKTKKKDSFKKALLKKGMILTMAGALAFSMAACTSSGSSSSTKSTTSSTRSSGSSTRQSSSSGSSTRQSDSTSGSRRQTTSSDTQDSTTAQSETTTGCPDTSGRRRLSHIRSGKRQTGTFPPVRKSGSDHPGCDDAGNVRVKNLRGDPQDLFCPGTVFNSKIPGIR